MPAEAAPPAAEGGNRHARQRRSPHPVHAPPGQPGGMAGARGPRRRVPARRALRHVRPQREPHLRPRARRGVLPHQSLRHALRGDHRLLARQDRPRGQHPAEAGIPRGGLRREPRRLRDPLRDPQGPARDRLRRAHPHLGGHGRLRARLRPPADHPDLHALRQGRLPRLQGRGAGPRHAGRAGARPRRPRRPDPAQPRPADGRPHGGRGVQRAAPAGAVLQDADRRHVLRDQAPRGAAGRWWTPPGRTTSRRPAAPSA